MNLKLIEALKHFVIDYSEDFFYKLAKLCKKKVFMYKSFDTVMM